MLSLYLTKGPNSNKALRSKLQILVTLVGNIIILQLKSKLVNIEDPKFSLDQSTTYPLICGHWPVWLSKCLQDNCSSIQEKTTQRPLVRTTIISLKWWNCWDGSPKSLHSEVPSQENITARKEHCKEYPSFKTGAWKTSWLRSIDSQTKKQNNSKTLCFQCCNATQKRDSWPMKCWSIHGFTRNLLNINCNYFINSRDH